MSQLEDAVHEKLRLGGDRDNVAVARRLLRPVRGGLPERVDAHELVAQHAARVLAAASEYCPAETADLLDVLYMFGEAKEEGEHHPWRRERDTHGLHQRDGHDSLTGEGRLRHRI